MDTNDLYEKITQELQHNLSVTDLYDFDQNKEHLRMVLLSVKSNRRLVEELPHLLFCNGENAGVFSLELFPSTRYSISHYITFQHLLLWKKTADDLYRLVTGDD